MSKQEQGASGSPDSKSSGDSQENQNQEQQNNAKFEDMVKYSSYQKAVDESKRKSQELQDVKQSMAEMQAKLDSMLEEKQNAEGNKDGIIETLKNKQDAMVKKIENYAYSSVKSQVSAVAKDFGCVDSDNLIKLIDVSGLTQTMDMETFQADKDLIKTMVEEAKEKMPFFFGKPGPNINNKNPGVNSNSFKKKSVKEMTLAEQEALIREIDKKEGKVLGKGSMFSS